jgi:hypothetical protein
MANLMYKDAKKKKSGKEKSLPLLKNPVNLSLCTNPLQRLSGIKLN